MSAPIKTAESSIGLTFSKNDRLFEVLSYKSETDAYVIGMKTDSSKPSSMVTNSEGYFFDNVEGVFFIPKKRLYSILHDPSLLVLT